MALLVFGKSICSLCGRVIQQGQRTYSFAAFILNELDPIFRFSDGAFHDHCIRNDQRGMEAIRRYEERSLSTGPGRRICVVCNTEVTSPDDHLFIEHLSAFGDAPLYKFNYLNFHRACLYRWKERESFLESVKVTLASGYWKGGYLFELLKNFSCPVPPTQSGSHSE